MHVRLAAVCLAVGLCGSLPVIAAPKGAPPASNTLEKELGIKPTEPDSYLKRVYDGGDFSIAYPDGWVEETLDKAVGKDDAEGMSLRAQITLIKGNAGLAQVRVFTKTDYLYNRAAAVATAKLALFAKDTGNALVTDYLSSTNEVSGFSFVWSKAGISYQNYAMYVVNNTTSYEVMLITKRGYLRDDQALTILNSFRAK